MRVSRRQCVSMLALAASGCYASPLFARTVGAGLNFTDAEIARQMWVVNDGVMGGRSDSRLVATPEGVLFEGLVSLENNGGFASARCPADFPAGVSALHLTARGDGKRYQFILRTDLSAMAPLYRCEFVASPSWTTHVFHPGDFSAAVRGRPVEAKPLILSEAKQVGILIADRQAGEFQIQLRELRAN